jgi:hypothetical protein
MNGEAPTFNRASIRAEIRRVFQQNRKYWVCQPAQQEGKKLSDAPSLESSLLKGTCDS